MCQRQPADGYAGPGGCFEKCHHQSRKDSTYKRLDSVEPQGIYIRCELVHQNNLGGKHECAAKGKKISDADLGNAHTAQTVQASYSQTHADGHHDSRLLFQKNTEHRYNYDVHCGKKAGFSRIGIHQTHLLQVAGKKQWDSAQQAGFPQLGISPALPGIQPVLFESVGNHNYRKQTDHSQKAANSLKSKGTNMVHANALRHKGGTPNNRG